MSSENLQIRHRFILVVAGMLLVLALLFCWNSMREYQLVMSGAENVLLRAAFMKQVLISGLFALLAMIWSFLFFIQLKNIKAANLSLLSQQQDLQLKAEMLDSASDAILLLDKHGHLLQFNNALCCITGRKRPELENMRIQDLKPPENAGMVEERIQRILTIGEAAFESVYLHVSGTLVPVEVHARSIEIGKNRHVLCEIRNISDRKIADDKIMSAVKEWQGTFDAVEDAVWLLDMNRKVVRANRATQQIFDKTPCEFVGHSCCKGAHADKQPHQTCPFERMLETKKRASMQMSIGNRWFEVSLDPVFSEDGTIINAVHIVKDITELKKSELREHIRSEMLECIARGESLSQLLSFIALSIEKERHGSLCSILLVDDDGRRLLNGAAPSLPDFYNKAVNRTKIGEGVGACGTAAFRQERVVVEDIATHPFWKGFTAAQEAGLRSCWSEPIFSASGQLLGTFAIYHRQPATPGDDEIRLIEQASAFAGIAIERSRNEAVRNELEQQLNQSQKMEAIGHLAGGVAHDFNNLLTPIIIYAEMLKRMMPDDEKLVPKVDGIINASHKARDLTQQLLSFGRKQVMQMQVIDLNVAITSFYSIMRRTLRESIDIKLQLSSQAAIIRADRSKLDQVILNLAINAQDAIEDTGQIIIETGQVMLDDEYARLHPGMRPGDYILLAFKDDGYGMSDETLRHIFEPFFTTKQVGHGTGLGLANVYGIVKQHNGYIAAVSKVGCGTTFKIYFPLEIEQPDGANAAVEYSTSDHAGTETILLVEDNEMVRSMTAELLEGLGYRVYVGEYPEHALELIKRNPEKIDLMITDVVMPGMNGQQLFERINAERPDIDRVLYMSGYTNNVIVNAGALEEGIHFLQKPFTVDALMSKVKELLH